MEERATTQGLDPGDLVILAGVATGSALGKPQIARAICPMSLTNKYVPPMSLLFTGIPHRKKLIKALLPRTSVPEQAVLVGLARLNSECFPRSVQPTFFKWILIVFELIDNKDSLRNLYGVLFLFLDFEQLRPHLCHLLYLLTRARDGAYC